MGIPSLSASASATGSASATLPLTTTSAAATAPNVDIAYKPQKKLPQWSFTGDEPAPLKEVMANAGAPMPSGGKSE